MDISTTPKASSISTQKHNSILVWRSEVASSLTPSPSPSTTSSTSSSSSTSNPPTNRHLQNAISFSNSSLTTTASPPAVFSVRARSLVSRIGRRISGRASKIDTMGSGGLGLEQGDGFDDGSFRTAMYASEAKGLPLGVSLGKDDGEGDVVLGDDEEESRDGRGLKEKQERLLRAARLLEKGPAKT